MHCQSIKFSDHLTNLILLFLLGIKTLNDQNQNFLLSSCFSYLLLRSILLGGIYPFFISSEDLPLSHPLWDEIFPLFCLDLINYRVMLILLLCMCMNRQNKTRGVSSLGYTYMFPTLTLKDLRTGQSSGLQSNILW